MRGLTIRVLSVSLLMTILPAFLASQEIVDGIAARVENDILLLSDIRTLSRYQQFLDGKAEPDSQILDRLIDQWVVRTEADVSLFPHPFDTEIERELERLRKSFGSAEQYEARRKQSGLSEAEVRTVVASQLYFSNYLDSRFRPSVQVDSKAIEDFYASTIAPQAKARGQEPPTLDAAHDLVQEALIQRGINEQAEKWLKESRERLHVEILLDGGSK